MAKYCVPIVYRGLAHFIVEAKSVSDADRKARARFEAGEKEDMLGNETEEIIRVDAIEEVK